MPPNKDSNDGPSLYLTLREVASADLIAPYRDVRDSQVQTFPALTPEEAAHLEHRLPKLEEAEKADFAVREGTLPLPVAGEQVGEPFPPPPDSGAVECAPQGGALEVVRCSPVGDVALASHVSITFSHPMVPLASLDSLEAAPVPVTITPPVEGRFRWAGDQTLLFEPSYRCPQSTEYTVRVPAGTAALDKAVQPLAQEFLSHFKTPTPQLKSADPGLGSVVGRRPVIAFEFDQDLDPLKVLQTVVLSRADTKKQVALKLLTPAEAETHLTSDPTYQNVRGLADGIRAMIATSLAERLVLLTPIEALTPNVEWILQLGPGIPSKEGPLLGTVGDIRTFRTFAPLELVRHRPTDKADTPPHTALCLTFNNDLNHEAFQDSWVTVQPPVQKMEVDVYGSDIVIKGHTAGRTEYKVSVDGSVVDIYGQTLGHQVTVTCPIGSAVPLLHSFTSSSYVVLDPTLPPAPTGLIPKTLTSGISHASGGPPAPLDYSVVIVNMPTLDVLLVSLTPSQYHDYSELELYDGDFSKLKELGQVVGEGTIPTNCEADKPTEVHVDLQPALKEGLGHVVICISSPKAEKQKHGHPGPRSIHTWVQCTRLGLSTFSSLAGDEIFVTSLADGQPLPGVEVVTDSSPNNQYHTDAHGMVRVPAPSESESCYRSRPGLLTMARAGGDSCFFTCYPLHTARRVDDQRTLYIFDDRKLYKPKETAHIKGIVRQTLISPDGTLRQLQVPPEGTEVKYILLDASYRMVLEGTTSLNSFGSFYFTVTFPDNVSLGVCSLEVVCGSGLEMHRMEVQEFRRPEFEAKCTASSGPHFLGGSVTLSTTADFYAGGPLSGANVRWSIAAAEAKYSPPGWTDFGFQDSGPFWMRSHPYEGRRPPAERKYHEANTDSQGQHRLCVDFTTNPCIKEQRPNSLTAEATITDINRQSMAATTTILIHPSIYYVGLACECHCPRPNKPFTLRLVVCDTDGNAVPDVAVALACTSEVHKRGRGGRYTTETVEHWTQNLISKTQELELPLTLAGGTYQLRATVTDAQGRSNTCSRVVWVMGGSLPSSSSVGADMEQVVMVPDKEVYAPGDSAIVTIQSPYQEPCWGVARVGCVGFFHTEPFQIPAGGSYELPLTIKEEWLPNVSICVELASAKKEDAGDSVQLSPSYAQGEVDLKISTAVKTLTVSVDAGAGTGVAHLQPGGSTDITIRVTDADRQPIPETAEVALWVVDEAVLALTSYSLDSAVDKFFPTQYQVKATTDLRRSLVRRNWDVQFSAPVMELAMCSNKGMRMMARGCPAPCMMACNMGDMDGCPFPGDSSAIAIRTNFDALACFHAVLPTDPATGTCTALCKLPDNLTRYRVYAVAFTRDTKFGIGEGAIEAALPLMVRPSLPRFLNVGDHSEFTVIVQNQTTSAADVAILAKASNLELADGAGYKLNLQPQQRSEVRFKVHATVAGTCRFQVGAEIVSGAGKGFADAADAKIPIWTPATSEAFASYGEISAPSGITTHAIQPPLDAHRAYGGLQISTSSTILQTVTDAYVYLLEYPYEAVEPTASRLLALVLLRDMQSAFDCPQLPKPDALNEHLEKALKTILQVQHMDGGFGWWSGSGEFSPYVTLHVAHCWARAMLKGVEVPLQPVLKVLDVVKDLKKRLPADCPKQTEYVLRSKACYVRSLFVMQNVEDPELHDEVKAVWTASGGVDGLGVEAAAWLACALHRVPPQPKSKGVKSRVSSALSHVTSTLSHTDHQCKSKVIIPAVSDALRKSFNETAETAHFVTSYSDAGAGKMVLLHSKHRTDAIVLEFLMETEPKNTIIPKLMKGLLKGRRKGRWSNTQENIYALIAMDKYYHLYESATPAFTANSWLDKSLVAQHQFQGRQTKTSVTDVPMAFLLDAEGPGPKPLKIQKQGDGRLYYRLGLKYAPKDNSLGALDAGFTVQRTYEAMEDPDDVQRTPDGGYTLKLGRTIKVLLTLENKARRYHVALVDKLPACLEAINPDLAGTSLNPPGASTTEPNCHWRYYCCWYEHQNLRDERVEAFASLVWEGARTYSYLAKATSLGTYVAPPATAEEMYAPEVFGRSPSLKVTVE